MLCWNYGLASTYIHELAESGGQTRGSAPTKKAYNCLSGQLYHRGAKDFSPLHFNKSLTSELLKLMGASLYCHERFKCKANGAQKPECTLST